MSVAPNPAALLEPYAHRRVRRVLDDDGELAAPLWSLIYGNAGVDHATAIAVDAELSLTDRTIGDVLAGWRPTALQTSGA